MTALRFAPAAEGHAPEVLQALRSRMTRVRDWFTMRRPATLIIPAALVLVACSPPNLNILPAPAAVDGDTYQVNAEFQNVLNLPIGAKVKQSGAIVGEVDSIRTKDFRAHLEMNIAKNITLQVGTRAQIRFSTPLGEDYVALYPPTKKTAAVIAAGDTISVADTGAAPTIEDAFAALSLLLNGGGIDQIQTIVHELDRTLTGRTGSIRTVIERSQQLVGTLNSSRGDIDRALAGLDSLAKTVGARQDVIDRALDQFPAALRVLADQTARINKLLSSVRNLSTVTTDVLNRSTDQLLADISLAKPALRSISDVRDQLVPTMEALTRFGKALNSAAPGDYLTADVTGSLVLDDSPILPRATNGGRSGQSAVRTLLGGSR